MSKRSERREAERLARKQAYLDSRNKISQSASLLPDAIRDAISMIGELMPGAMEELTPPPVLEPTEPPAPATLEGRDRSARNATKHGCCADTLILEHESVEDYKALQSTWFTTYKPKDEGEKNLIEKLIKADWLYQRATNALTEVEADLYDANPNASQWTEQQQRTFGRFQRYQTAKANLFNQAKKAVEDHRKARQAELDRAAKLALLEERLKAFKKKNNQKEPTWQEHLDDMKKQAISLGFTPPTEDEL